MQPDYPAPTEPLAAWDTAYGHFARTLGGRVPEGCDPVLLQTATVRLTGKDLAAACSEVAAALAAGVLYLTAEDGETPALPGDASPFHVAFPDPDPGSFAAQYGKVLEVLALSGPLARPLSPERAEAPARRTVKGPSGAAPIVAMIDDGVGFLNARFRKPGSPARTRFHAVWLQAFRTVQTPGGAPGYVQTGRVLTRAEIDGWLGLGDRLDEAQVYREINRSLLDPAAHRSSEYGFSHGTHVLDIAAGADPAKGGAVRDWPLLAVQLPPEAVDNTAGTQLEPMLVQGVRWCLKQAAAIPGGAPLVIVIAFATFAGPKDGTKAVEALIAQAVEGWRAATGREARVVLSFGNTRLTRQAARLTLVPGTPQGLDWRLLPEDFTASYLELRPDDPADLARLSLTLLPPGSPPGMPPQALAPLPANTSRTIRDPEGRPVGRAYHLGPRTSAPGVTTPAHLVLALAPTVEEGFRPVAAHGAWTLGLAATGAGSLPLRMEVQRDDTPGGYRQKGRQSWLDHPAAWGREAETGGWSAPGASPVTRAGSHSSFVTAASAALVPVGAARADKTEAARYSAEGANWARPGPDLAALSDRCRAVPGLVGAGTMTGSVRALDGTSVAAARAARALATEFVAHGAGAPGPAEIAALVAGGPPAAPDPARLGAGVLAGPASGADQLRL